MSAVPIATVKTHINFTGVPADDEVLQSFIDAAEATIAERVGPLVPTIVVEQARASRGVLSMTTCPVISLISVTDARTGAVLAGADLEVDTDAGLVYGRSTLTSSGPYTITYQAGRATLPADLAMAVKELVRHLWTHAQRGQGRPRTTDSTMAGYLIPNMVAALLAEHLGDRGPGFA